MGWSKCSRAYVHQGFLNSGRRRNQQFSSTLRLSVGRRYIARLKSFVPAFGILFASIGLHPDFLPPRTLSKLKPYCAHSKLMRLIFDMPYSLMVDIHLGEQR